MKPTIAANTLFYGDNLAILREHIPDESVDLVYLDPPFNSNRNYNVLFKDERGREAEAQIEAFEDTWHWSEAAEETYHELVTEASDEVSKAIAALRDLIGTNQVMAYLVMMAARLVEGASSGGDFYIRDDPNWSPDGSKILFVRSGPCSGSCTPEAAQYDVWVMNADGGGHKRLTNNLVNDLDPAWSPDGTRIVFTRSSSSWGRAGDIGFAPSPRTVCL